MSDKAKVIWLSGNLHERKLLLAKIREEFVSAEIQTLDGNYSVAYLEQIIRQDSIFSEQRVVIIKEMPTPTSARQTMVNQLKKLLDDLPDNCLVVFYGIPADSEKAISGHVSKIGKLFDYIYKLDPNKAAGWLQGIFDELGKDISIEDAQLLIETSGHDKSVGGIGVDLLRMLAQKIALYLGRRRKVETTDIQVNIFPSEDIVIWTILDALDSKDLAACYNAFGKLVDKEDQSVTKAINILWNIALPRYRLLMFLKEGIASGKSKQDVGKEALDLRKLAQEGKDWGMRMVPEIVESGQNAGQPKGMFNEFAVNTALHGGFNRKPILDIYSRKEIVRIVNCLEGGFGELRARSQSESAMQMMADVLFLAVCTQIDDTILGELRTPYGYIQ